MVFIVQKRIANEAYFTGNKKDYKKLCDLELKNGNVEKGYYSGNIEQDYYNNTFLFGDSGDFDLLTK